MKKILFILIFLGFFMFSCAGTPKTDEDTPDSAVEEIEESPETEDELADQQEDITETEITDVLETDDSLSQDELAETDLTEQDEPVTETAVEEEPEIVETPVIVEAPPVVELPPPQRVPEPVAQPRPEPPPALIVQAEEEPPELGGEDTEQDNVQEQQVDIPPFKYEPPFVSAVRDDDSLPVRPGARIPRTEEIVFSRTVRAVVGQIVEVPFRGTGWVYLGELASRRGIVYNSRRLDPQGQSFIFRAEEAGTYALKFYRQDFIRDYILNDYVQVIVGEPPEAGGAAWFNTPFDRGRVIAQPRWPSALDEAEIQRGGSPGSRPAAEPSADPRRDGASQAQSSVSDTQPGAPVAKESAASQSPSAVRETSPVQPPLQNDRTPAAAPPVITTDSLPPAGAVSESPEKPPLESQSEAMEKWPADVLLQKAQEAFDGGNVAAAIALLDQYAEYFPSGTDELYWLYGQFYEANTPSRNILLSLDYYRRLVREYPQSSRYNDARRRIAYLERFYININ